MTRRGPGRGQAALFDLPARQAVHIAVYSRLAAALVCLVCKVNLAVADVWDDCASCPGWVEPAPPWVLLTAVEEPADEPAQFEEAA